MSRCKSRHINLIGLSVPVAAGGSLWIMQLLGGVVDTESAANGLKSNRPNEQA
jgi:hypothetical protein